MFRDANPGYLEGRTRRIVDNESRTKLTEAGVKFEEVQEDIKKKVKKKKQGNSEDENSDEDNTSEQPS